MVVNPLPPGPPSGVPASDPGPPSGNTLPPSGPPVPPSRSVPPSGPVSIFPGPEERQLQSTATSTTHHACRNGTLRSAPGLSGLEGKDGRAPRHPGDGQERSPLDTPAVTVRRARRHPPSVDAWHLDVDPRRLDARHGPPRASRSGPGSRG